MILILAETLTESQSTQIQTELRCEGFSYKEIEVADRRLLEVTGNPGQDLTRFSSLPGVEQVIASPPAFKLASREAHRADTVVQVGDVAVGGERIVVMAGPCSIESRAQAMAVADACRRYGAVLFRGGAFKPRSSPYSFQGLGEEGLKILAEVREQTGMRTVSEVTSTDTLELMLEYVDVLQIGARNMQNFELLKRVGKTDKPVLLKRGLSATIEEWLMSAEYILSEGNPNVILCERGIRTFEPYTRNTLDLSAIPVVKRLTHLPILIDPSHATGIREKVIPMARAAIAAGADGLMIEVHNEPAKAKSDGAQSLYPEQFGQLMRDIHVIAPVVEKQLDFGYLDKARAVSQPVDVDDGNGLKVAILGDVGTFSHRACLQYFGENVTAIPTASYRAAFEAVQAGYARFAVVPLENSLTGSVHENYDLLLDSHLKIVGEIMLRIVYSLIGHDGTEIGQIRRVFSHPDVFRQCREFVSGQGWELVSTQDEATAVHMLTDRDDVADAAIAGRDAAETHGMTVLQEGIETNPRNYTRFGIIGATPLTDAPRRKSSLIYQTPNEPGALYETLGLFSEHGVNLVKLESRPIHGKPWEYLFYVDIEADAESPEFEPTLKALKEKTDYLAILGSY
ncbi:MAG: 3-deoxy-7-phosphoheptulonate synthase [Lentisphaerae bacterium]|nr:3-deoxy-7-phosphoheptulonate synthase [Lentisphaerota bacterium]MBT4821842.1 3-deoxy-7-phosphoheptulonate synthase [Lentisphaerota bacterium]MBT5605483.1 3-deoxy-7-phosphoheptulonate synthase [Lentisphaerota bacterium]MBT7060086.1 3-deoxy-7-phosphoheptulonate synthase [Lentisphaerota bacterium]MBT7840854.1 3-deoxy-7-phosphoheptulonate synthase [Lentisphaerota bacterium]